MIQHKKCRKQASKLSENYNFCIFYGRLYRAANKDCYWYRSIAMSTICLLTRWSFVFDMKKKNQSLDSANCLILGLFSTAVKYISLFNVVVEFEAKSLNELVQIIHINRYLRWFRWFIQTIQILQIIHTIQIQYSSKQ